MSKSAADALLESQHGAQGRLPRASDAGSSLGKRLRDLRRKNGWTLARVSEMTGVSVSTLSKLENGRTSLSFSSVLQLADGLDIPVASMIGPVDEPLGTARRSITRRGSGILHKTRGVTFEVLCDELVHKSDLYWRVTVTCRSLETFGEFHRHPGEEFLHVLSGTLVLHTEFYEPVILEVGDSIHFDAAMGHAYVAAGGEDAVILMVNSIGGPISGFREGPMRELTADRRR